MSKLSTFSHFTFLCFASACDKNLSLLVSQFYKKIHFYQNFATISGIEKCRSRTLASAAGCILCKYNKLHTAFKGSSLQNTYSHKYLSLIFLVIQSLLRWLICSYEMFCFTTQCNQNKTFEKPYTRRRKRL